MNEHEFKWIKSKHMNIKVINLFKMMHLWIISILSETKKNKSFIP